MRTRSRRDRRSERGNVLVFVTLALIALLAFAAWSTETGQAWTAKGQLQGASDSAALAGAGALLDPNGGQPSDPPAAIAAAQKFGAQNYSIGVPITIPAGDIETGSWDIQNRLFTPLPGSTDPEQVRAVKVLGRRDDVANGPVPTVLGRIFGVDAIPIAADAIAYIGFAGLMPKGSAVLPIALDCCKHLGLRLRKRLLRGDRGQSAEPCSRSRTGPNAGAIVSGLEFPSTGEQNACWTVFDPGSPAVSANDLRDIVRDGNSFPVGADPIYLDNGTKTPVIDEINERFEGKGGYSGNPSGTDLDGDGDSRLLAGAAADHGVPEPRPPLRERDPPEGRRRGLLRHSGSPRDAREDHHGQPRLPGRRALGRQPLRRGLRTGRRGADHRRAVSSPRQVAAHRRRAWGSALVTQVPTNARGCVAACGADPRAPTLTAPCDVTLRAIWWRRRESNPCLGRCPSDVPPA